MQVSLDKNLQKCQTYLENIYRWPRSLKPRSARVVPYYVNVHDVSSFYFTLFRISGEIHLCTNLSSASALMPILHTAYMYVSIHFACTRTHVRTVERLSNAFSTAPLFLLLVALCVSRHRARTRSVLSSLPSLPFSLFVRASHGSIIRNVSNFRLSEFFARFYSRARCPRQHRVKISRGSISPPPSARCHRYAPTFCFPPHAFYSSSRETPEN